MRIAFKILIVTIVICYAAIGGNSGALRRFPAKSSLPKISPHVFQTPPQLSSSHEPSRPYLSRQYSVEDEALLHSRLDALFPRFKGLHITGWENSRSIAQQLDPQFKSGKASVAEKTTRNYSQSDNFVSTQSDSFTQAWTKSWGSGLIPSADAAYSITTDPQGSVYVTGESDSTYGYIDIVTRKYSSGGALLWSNRYNGPGYATDIPFAITSDAFGNVYVAGTSVGLMTAYDFVTIKYNTNGNEEWVSRYDGPNHMWDIATTVVVDAQGNVYIGGGSGRDQIHDQGFFDYATVKYNSDGVEQWVSRYNGSLDYDDGINALAIDSIGYVYVTGLSNSEDGGADIVTIKYDQAGVEQWVNKYNGPSSGRDEAYAIAVDRSDNVFVTGYSYDSLYTDEVTIKYSSLGDLKWVRRFDGPGHYYDIATSIGADRWGNVYVGGRAYNANIDFDFSTIKYDSNGMQLWTKLYDGGFLDDAVTALALDDSGNVYVTGQSGFTGQDYNFATIKYKPNGTVAWMATYDNDNHGQDFPRAITLDASHSVVVAGQSLNPGTFLDMKLVKYLGNGTRQWVASYNGAGGSTDFLISMFVDGSGRSVELIASTSGGLNDAKFHNMVTLQYNAEGTQNWIHTIPSCDPAALGTDLRGNLYSLGSEALPGGVVTNSLLVMYSSGGIQKWLVRFGTKRTLGIAVDIKGNVFATGLSGTFKFDSSGVQRMFIPDSGSSISVDANGNIFILDQWKNISKYDSAGHQTWSGIFGGVPVGFGLDPQGSIYVIGTVSSVQTVRKFDPNGIQQWSTTHPSGTADKIFLGKSNDLFVMGSSGTVKYNLQGVPEWTDSVSGVITFDECGYTYLSHSEQVDSGGFGPTWDVVTYKYSPAGEPIWHATWDAAAAHGVDAAIGLGLDSQGNLFVGGYSTIGDGYGMYVANASRYTHIPKLSLSQSDLVLGDVNTTCTRIETLTVHAMGCTQSSEISISSNDSSFSGQVIGSSSALRESIEVAVKFSPSAPGAMTGHLNIVHSPTGSSVELTVHGTGISQRPSYSSQSISFDETTVGCQEERIVSVTNLSCSTLNFVSMSCSDSNFHLTEQALSVPPSESRGISVVFQPLSVGPKSALIIIHHNQGSLQDTVTVNGTAIGNGSEIVIHDSLGTGWQLISVPMRGPCLTPLRNSFEYAGKYNRVDSLMYGKGYWNKLTIPDIYFAGVPTDAESITVAGGWNIVGSFSTPISVSEITSIPSGILKSHFFGYSAGYSTATTIDPGHAYWVKASQSGLLVFHVGPLVTPKAAASDSYKNLSVLTLIDKIGNTQNLYFGAGSLTDSQNTGELPPLPPDGVFDVRFQSGRIMEVLDKQESGELPIVISSALYPVSLIWERRDPTRASIGMGGKEINLEKRGSAELQSSESKVVLRLQSKSPIPKTFLLYQNYPNPFNPTTTIEYDLAENVHVNLRVFNILGQLVKVLVDEGQNAGHKSMTFDASSLPSALYFYKLQAGAFSDVKKLVVVR